MRHTMTDTNGKEITIDNIPMTEVRGLMKNLGLSLKEAADLWCYDNGKVGNEEAAALTAKAKANGANGTRAKRTSTKPRKAPARKPDEDKRMLIAALAKALGDTDGVGNVNVEKVERLITFALGDDTYKLTLSKDRKPKVE